MEILPGRCFKCQALLHKRGVVSTNYCDLLLTLSDGNFHKLGSCCNCTLEDSDREAVMEAVNKAVKDRNGKSIHEGASILSVERKTFMEALKDAQGGKCAVSGEELGDNYVVTRGGPNGWCILKEGSSLGE